MRAVLAGLIALIAPCASGAFATDADVFARIEAQRPIAAAIAIDGDGSDWAGIPVFADPSGDAGGDPSRDITGVAIAATDDALYVRIDTAAPPPTSGREFWLLFDFRSQQFWDVKLSLNLDFTDDLDVFPEDPGESGFRTGWEESEVAVGSVVEVRIPYAELDAELTPSMQGQLSGSGARPWVRVKATTGEPFFTEIDHGSAVGAFRLVATPYALDPSLPPGADAPVETRLPLEQRWYVGQGSHGISSHASIPWAYDLHRVDNALLPESPPGSADNADNFSFGSAIRAPADGTVFSLHDGEADCVPYAGCASAANFVFVEIPGDVGLLFSHAQQNSVAVQASDPVGAGDLLAAVGNSGSAFVWSHLHYEAQDILNLPASLPLALVDVDVGLNPGDDDPWVRSVSGWGIREGFFVAPQPPSIPALGTSARAGGARAALLGALVAGVLLGGLGVFARVRPGTALR